MPLRPTVAERFKNQVLRPALHRVAAAASLPCNALWGERRRASFGILMYHRVTDPVRGLPAPTWNVPPRRFRAQIEGLLKRGYEAWPLRRVLEFHSQGRPIPARAFVVTFDDGFECVFTEAWPILKELRVPATVFLATGYLGSEAPVPFDDWPAAGSPRAPAAAWRLMGRDQCDELLSQGLVELGSHTHWHDDYTRRPDAFAADLAQSQSRFRQWFGQDDCSFAFPFGRHTEAMVTIARSSALLCALTVERNLITPQSDPFTWGRFAAEPSDTAGTLAAKLAGWYTPFRDGWRRLLLPRGSRSKAHDS